jgi:GDP-L-fucose synthase
MNTYSDEGLVNIGTGEDISISDLALMIKDVVGYEGAIVYDATKPDGTPRKLMDVTKLSGLGWKYTISLKKGLEMVYQEYQSRQ